MERRRNSITGQFVSSHEIEMAFQMECILDSLTPRARRRVIAMAAGRAGVRWLVRAAIQEGPYTSTPSKDMTDGAT